MGRIIIVRGGGDLSSGVIIRMFRAGFRVVVTELSQPLAVRRTVSFSQAVYDGEVKIEDVNARLVENASSALTTINLGIVPVLIDPTVDSRYQLDPLAIVDGRMTKSSPDLDRNCASLYVGLGPGFIAGENCHAVIETRRGPNLGRVIWSGSAEADTGLPDKVASFQAERVLRAPADGILETHAQIGEHLESGQMIAEVGGKQINALFSGVLRGLLRTGIAVRKGMKIGDLDPRDDPDMVKLVSDKALAVGGAVMEALLAKPEIRSQLW